MTALSPPLEMDFGHNPGPRSFATFEEVSKFAEDDRTAWEQIETTVRKTSAWNSLGRLFSDQQTALRDIQNELTRSAPKPDAQSTNPVAYAETLSRYANESVIHFESQIGRLAMTLCNAGNAGDVPSLIWAARRGVGNERNPLFLNDNNGQSVAAFPLLTGVILAVLAKRGIPFPDEDNERLQDMLSKADGVTAALQSALGEFRTKSETELAALADQRQQRAQASEDMLLNAKSTFDTAQAAHVERMKTIEETFKQKMGLRAPREYWASKQASHKRRAGLWLRWFLSGCVLGLVAAVLTVKWAGDAISAASTITPETWLLVGLPVVLVLWILRLLHKQATTQFALAEDAYERVTMVETYLALFEENKVQEVERPLILQPLFRPTSAAGEEGMQAGIVERVIDALARK